MRLDLTARLACCVMLGLALAPAKSAAADEAEALAPAFADEAFCLFVPPEPITGVFEPEPAKARALKRDHDFAMALEAPLRRAATESVFSLAPSEPFDAATIAAGGPTLARIMHRLLWLYADYWLAARAVLVERTEPTLPLLGLAPLRGACEPAVVLFVFTSEADTIAGAGWLSLLTGRVLAELAP